MKIYVSPTGLHSRAMTRVANALTRYAPPTVSIVSRPEDCDLQVLHVINRDAIPYARNLTNANKKYAVIQYCLRTSGADLGEWSPTWANARLVWSYYDLRDMCGLYGVEAPPGKRLAFYHAPLGVDDVFRAPFDPLATREPLVVTTGYVTGPCAEPIEEVWRAARLAKLKTFHVGPRNVQNATIEPDEAVEGVSDAVLAGLYRSARWVSALRYVEGFELPGLEGAMCGARPIVFNQPSMRYWYAGLAYRIPEYGSENLIENLTRIFQDESSPISQRDVSDAARRFNWQMICAGFWDRLLSNGGAA
jgi:glycosyltransferase involved in cell wall biosynthesis